jgi:hypothetical protein
MQKIAGRTNGQKRNNSILILLPAGFYDVYRIQRRACVQCRDGVYEVVFDESVYLRPDDYRLVYYSAGSSSILGVSPVFSVR